MVVARDLASPDLWKYARERAERRREAARRRRRIQRISVPLAVVATAAGANVAGYTGTAVAAGAKPQRASHRHGILRRGSHGPLVAQLQRLLGIAPNGLFGRRTDRHVRRFQARHNLLVDGEVGPQTWAAIQGELRGDSDAGALRLGDRGPRVAEMQRLLGVVADGDFGPITRHAVRHFQETHGLIVEGEVGASTIAALRARGGGRHHASHHMSRRVEAILHAERQIGTPYAWGGATPAGFDCSGLVKWAYGKVGIHLPHFAAAQYRVGRHVARRDLRRGDLVFFDHLGHVGIYVGGDHFVESPHAGASVRISAITGWYARHYDGATRVA